MGDRGAQRGAARTVYHAGRDVVHDLSMKKDRQLVMNQRSFFLKIGRGDRTRTCDSLVPNQERYQLRYTSFARKRMQRYKEKVKSSYKAQKKCYRTTIFNDSAVR